MQVAAGMHNPGGVHSAPGWRTCRTCRQGKGVCRRWDTEGHLQSEFNPRAEAAAVDELEQGSMVEAQWPPDVAAFKERSLDPDGCTWYRATIGKIHGASKKFALKYSDGGEHAAVPISMIRLPGGSSATSPAAATLKVTGHGPTPSPVAPARVQKAPAKRRAPQLTADAVATPSQRSAAENVASLSATAAASESDVRVPWAPEEDAELALLVRSHGHRWELLASLFSVERTAHAMQKRWSKVKDRYSTTSSSGNGTTADANGSGKRAKQNGDGTAAHSNKYPRIKDGSASRAVTKSGRVHLTRHQATAAGVVIQPKFDPQTDWDQAEKEEIVHAVNNAFREQELPPTYTVKNLESWRKNAAYKWTIQQRGYVPPSWGGDHKLPQLSPHQRQQHGAVPQPASKSVHNAATKSLTAEEAVLAAAAARALRGDIGEGQSKYQRCDDGAGAAGAVSGRQPSPLLAATATAADHGGVGASNVQSATRAKQGRVKISRAQTLAAGRVIQPYWDSGVLAQRDETVWERICAEVNAEWDAHGLESPPGASPRYTLQNLNSWFRNATYKKVCADRDYNPPSWGGTRISTKIRRKYTRRDQHSRAGSTSWSTQDHSYPWTVSENQVLLQAVQMAGGSQSDVGGSCDPDWNAVARTLRLNNIAEGGPIRRVRSAGAIARQHGCLVNEIEQTVGQVLSALVHDLEEEAQEMQTATTSYWEDAVEYNKRQQQRLLPTAGDGDCKVSAAGNRVFQGGLTSRVGHNNMVKGSQWTQCTGLYVLEHLEEAKQLYARIAHRAKRQRIVDYIANSILQDNLNRAAAVGSVHGKPGSTQFILNAFSEERTARLAAAINKRLVEADLPPEFSVSRVKAWLNTAIRSQYGSTDHQLEMGRNSSGGGHQLQKQRQHQHQEKHQQHQHQHHQREEYDAEDNDEYDDDNDEYDDDDDEEEPQQPPQLTSNTVLFDLAAAMITGKTDETSGGDVAGAESLPHIGDAEQLLVELSSPRESDCQADSSAGSFRNKHDKARHGNEAVESSYDAEGGKDKLASTQPQSQQPQPPSITSPPTKSEEEVTPVNRSPICHITARLLLPSPGQPQQAGGEPVATKRRRVMPASAACTAIPNQHC